MTPDIALALTGFAFVASITPGPNNIMLLASGVNYGFWRTMPHMAGIAVGFGILLAGVGLGLGQLLQSWPAVFNALKWICALYLIYLAWRIANSGPPEAGSRNGQPLPFLHAAAFQWVNPKAWFMALTAMAIYTSLDRYLLSVVLVIIVFSLVNLPCLAVWCGMGSALRGLLGNPSRLRIFNYCMALLLIASLYPILT